MTRTTFASIIENIGPSLIRKDVGPNVVCPEKQLCVTLWTLCNQEVYRSVADRFGVSKDTAWNCVLKVCQVLNDVSEQYIIWPEIGQLHQIAENFENLAGFPNVIAAMDGCHIPVSAPSTDSVSYINRKNFHSLILQGACDSNRKFVDVFAGVCGSVHDARVFDMSPIKAAIIGNPGRYCPQDMHILGDSAYGIRPYLMTPFKNYGNLTPTQVNYNTIHSRTRVVVERAFGLLKGRFRRLKYLYLQNIRYGPLIIMACCVLHNICLDLNDEANADILEDMEDDPQDDVNVHNGRDVVAAAAQKRQNIANRLMEIRI